MVVVSKRAPTRARAPYPQVVHGRIPLTLCAVLEILLGVNHDGDWAKAITAAVPPRQSGRPLSESRKQRRAVSRAAIAKTWGVKAPGGGTPGACADGEGEEEEGEEEEEGGEEEEEEEEAAVEEAAAGAASSTH